MGYSPQGHKESDTAEVTEHAHTPLFMYLQPPPAHLPLCLDFSEMLGSLLIFTPPSQGTA